MAPVDSDERHQLQTNEANYNHLNTKSDSDHRAVHQSTLCHIWSDSPVNTVPHGGQIIVHFTSQHTATWWSDHRAFHQSTHCHIWSDHRQHCATLWSDHRALHQSTPCHMVVRLSSTPCHVVIRSSCISPVNTVTHCGQIIQSTLCHIVVRSYS